MTHRSLLAWLIVTIGGTVSLSILAEEKKAEQAKAGDDAGRTTVYCKYRNLKYNPGVYTCDWSKVKNSACSFGGVTSSIDRDFVTDLNPTFEQCPNNNDWISRAVMN